MWSVARISKGSGGGPFNRKRCKKVFQQICCNDQVTEAPEVVPEEWDVADQHTVVDDTGGDGAGEAKKEEL